MFSSKMERWKIAVFFIYIALLSIAISRHEPWFDEAQAWLLARDSSIFDLLTKYLRYEGSPGLWHLILAIPAKLHFPYFTLNVISGVIAAIGIYVFLRNSPFPKLITILFPFSFFAFYQYAVVARSYVLMPLLLFIAASLYKNRNAHPYIYTILLCLLANVSLHGLIIAAGLMFVLFLELIHHWIKGISPVKLQQLAPFAIFAVVIVLLFFELKPTSDLISFAAYNHNLDAFYPRCISMFRNALAVASDNRNIVYRFYSYFSAISIVITLMWLLLTGKLLPFLIPTLGLGLLFTVIYANVWHQGIMFLIWIFVLWISYERVDNKDRLVAITNRLMTIVLLLILSFQVYWSFSAFLFDYQHNYSGSKKLAAYIKENKLENKKIYMTNFHTISVLPYFSENIFCNYNKNQKPAFWFWSSKNSMYTEPYLSISSYNPDFIVMGVKSYIHGGSYTDDTILPSIQGYKVERIFFGSLYWKDEPFETDSFILYGKIK